MTGRVVQPEWLTTGQAAEFLGVSSRSMERLNAVLPKKLRLPGFARPQGVGWLYRRSALEKVKNIQCEVGDIWIGTAVRIFAALEERRI